MTACWSKGRHGTRYPYYYCVAKGCESRSKMVRRYQLEGEFQALLPTITPPEPMFQVLRHMLRDWWEHLAERQALG